MIWVFPLPCSFQYIFLILSLTFHNSVIIVFSVWKCFHLHLIIAKWAIHFFLSWPPLIYPFIFYSWHFLYNFSLSLFSFWFLYIFISLKDRISPPPVYVSSVSSLTSQNWFLCLAPCSQSILWPRSWALRTFIL